MGIYPTEFFLCFLFSAEVSRSVSTRVHDIACSAVGQDTWEGHSIRNTSTGAFSREGHRFSSCIEGKHVISYLFYTNGWLLHSGQCWHYPNIMEMKYLLTPDEKYEDPFKQRHLKSNHFEQWLSVCFPFSWIIRSI